MDCDLVISERVLIKAHKRRIFCAEPSHFWIKVDQVDLLYRGVAQDLACGQNIAATQEQNIFWFLAI